LVITGSATNIDFESADLAGVVNAMGQLTSVYFEYGLTTAYGNNISGTPNNISTNMFESISVGIGSLKSNTEYHYRIVAESDHGITYGADSVFNTLINSIDEINLQDQVEIRFEDGALLIRLNNQNLETIHFNIFDMVGNEVLSTKIRNEVQIQLKSPEACYLLQFISNHEAFTKKLIIR